MKTIKYGLLVEGLVHYNTYYNGAPNEKKKCSWVKFLSLCGLGGLVFFVLWYTAVFTIFSYLFLIMREIADPLLIFFPSKFYINLCLHWMWWKFFNAQAKILFPEVNFFEKDTRVPSCFFFWFNYFYVLMLVWHTNIKTLCEARTHQKG